MENLLTNLPAFSLDQTNEKLSPLEAYDDTKVLLQTRKESAAAEKVVHSYTLELTGCNTQSVARG